MWMEPATYAAILEDIIRPTIHQMALIGAPYSGLLYAGVMVTDDGPKALEFNCRFGDPETQVILPRLGSDLLELMIASEVADLAGREVIWSADKAVCVVLASEGYPESSSSGDGISGLENIPAGVYIYHAGTEERDGAFYTAGGRVLNVVGHRTDRHRGARPRLRGGRADPLRRHAVPHGHRPGGHRAGGTLSPSVGILVGSKSDLPVMEKCTARLEDFGVEYELEVRSRAPQPRRRRRVRRRTRPGGASRSLSAPPGWRRTWPAPSRRAPTCR